MARIGHYLELNRTRRAQGLHKQQMKHCDIHQALLDEGHQIGYTSPGRPYDTADVRSLRVDKYGCVRVDNNSYSVPDDQVGRMVEARVGSR